MKPTIADALERCIGLMLRAAPHMNDRDEWHDTLREASKLLARNNPEPELLRYEVLLCAALGGAVAAVVIWILTTL